MEPSEPILRRTVQATAAQIGQACGMRGWVQRKRNHGSLLFIDLRDYDGLVQCCIDASDDPLLLKQFDNIRVESCIQIGGVLRRRPAGTENPKLVTGEVEIVIHDVNVLNGADVLPFEIDSDEHFNAPEDMRLQYRFLDLRRPKMQRNLRLRYEVIRQLRDFMHQLGFMEVQTPILTASSPEGARDYLVPSRLHRGLFYALPQAPQQFKQLLMASGVERYFQIAPCFRDESSRSDRLPGEFYQLDFEIAHGTQEQVFEVAEQVIGGLFESQGKPAWDRVQVSHDGVKAGDPIPWPRYPYADALVQFGNDKPDLRSHVRGRDLTDLFRHDGPEFFREIVRQNGVIRALPIRQGNEVSSAMARQFEKEARELGLAGLGYLRTGVRFLHDAQANRGPMAKFFSPEMIRGIEDASGMALHSNTEQIVFFAGGDARTVNAAVAKLRVSMAKAIGEYDEDAFKLCFVTDYPMFERNEDGAIDFSHNPFSMPQGGEAQGVAIYDGDPLSLLAYQYDLVCNGVEISSGAVRNHRPDMLRRAFEIAGYAPDTIETSFPALLSAFRFGCPPHAGMAPGIERILMLLSGETNIREVVAFPLNSQAKCDLMGAPSEVPLEHLRELGIRVVG